MNREGGDLKLEIRSPLINPDARQKTSLLGEWSPFVCAWCESGVLVISAWATNSHGRKFHVSCAEQAHRFATSSLLGEEP